MLTGWKTLIFSAATALLGVATAFNWTSVVNATDAGYVITGLGIIGGILRFLTNGPVGVKTS